MTRYAAQLKQDTVVTIAVLAPGDDDDESVQADCHNLGLTGQWLNADMDGAQGRGPAAIGATYDPQTDQFSAPPAPTQEGPE